jgi:hypothetical protein
MFGRQGWKLQTDIESLVSRLLKARYYLHSNYLASSIGHNPSYCGGPYQMLNFLFKWASVGVLSPVQIFQ